MENCYPYSTLTSWDFPIWEIWCFVTTLLKLAVGQCTIRCGLWNSAEFTVNRTVHMDTQYYSMQVLMKSLQDEMRSICTDAKYLA